MGDTDISKLVLEIDSKGVVSGRLELEKLGTTATKTEKSAKSMMDKFREMQSIMQGPVAAVQMFAAKVQAAVRAMDELVMAGAEAQASMTNFESVLQATGGVAGVTTSELVQLADQLAGSTLFDDDAIRDAETSLMRYKTFTGETFKEVIRLSADLAQVGGGSVKQYAEAIAKAAKREEEGITQLKRAGIVFTKDQEDMMKNLYATGRAAEAQKIMMKELADQVGGASANAAKTAAGSFLEMKEAMDDAKESLGILMGSLAKESGFNDFIKDQAQRVNDDAAIKAGMAKWLTGSLNESETSMLLEAANRELMALKEDVKKWGWQDYVPGMGTDWKERLKEMENFRNSLLTLQAQYEKAGRNKPKPAPAPTPPTAKEETSAEKAERLRREAEELRKLNEERERLNKNLQDEITYRYNTDEGLAAYVKTMKDAEDATKKLAEEEEARAAAERKRADDRLAIMGELEESVKDLLVSMGQKGYLDIMEQFGEALMGSETANADMAASLANMGATILNQLPSLLFYAGVQCLIAGQVPLGVALILASGLVEIGKGVANYYAGQASASSGSAGASASAQAAASSMTSTGAGSFKVTIDNKSGTPLEGNATMTQNGMGEKEFLIELDRAVGSSSARGSADRVMGSRFGVKPLPARRN